MTGDNGSKQGTLQGGVACPKLANLYICFTRSLVDPFRFDSPLSDAPRRKDVDLSALHR